MILGRRQFVTAVSVAACAAACRGSAASEQSRLTARPRAAATKVPRPPAGIQKLRIGGERDAVLMIPAGAPESPLPVLVLLHGAGGNGGNILRRLGSEVDTAGIAVLSPDSRDPRSWDAIRGSLGPDVEFLNRALTRVFETVDVDPARISVGGFSDGATYALTLGLINGDLFSRVVAWSPGFYVSDEVRGKPRFFVSHGRDDEILPIARCSRVIVPRLQQRGYQVTYREFDGGHMMPPEMIREGLAFATSA